MFRSRIKLVLLFLLVFCISCGAGAYTGGKLKQTVFGGENFAGTVGVTEKNIVNILFMGIDARDTESNSRSDTMIMASINTESQEMAMISIPRDTRIKSSSGKDEKINGVNYLEGPEAACEAVGELLNTPVEYYVVTNFAGFSDIVDTLGGVHIDVENDMYHSDPVKPELEINIHKGYQYMDGKTALNYVRYRGKVTADIGRTQRQQKFIRAMADEMLDSRTIFKLPKLIPQLKKSIKTNLPAKEIAYLAGIARDFDTASIASQTLPGYSHSVSGASYWEVDHEKAKTIIADLFDGQSFDIFETAPAGSSPKVAVAKPSPEAKEQVENKPQEQETIETDSEEKGVEVESESQLALEDDNKAQDENKNNSGTSIIEPQTEDESESNDSQAEVDENQATDQDGVVDHELSLIDQQ